MTEQERQRRRFIRQELKKKNLFSFMKEFGVSNRAWLKELTDKYKERGVFPLSPLILSDYYQNYEDKLLATLIASLLLDDNSRIMQQVTAMRKLLGKNPYKELYSNRTFVSLSNGANQTKPISYFGSVQYWQVAKLLDIIWEIEHEWNKSIFDYFFELITIKEYTPYHALANIFENMPISAPDWRINLALLRLCSNDGIGEHLWDIGGLTKKLKCPSDIKIRKFLNNWLPKWQYTFNFDEVCSILGFSRETDIYYCYLAFKELALSKSKEIQDYLHVYNTQFNHRTLGVDGRKWMKKRTPSIEFGE